VRRRALLACVAAAAALGAMPASAAAVDRFVDRDTGNSLTDCSSHTSPCETIFHALDQAQAGDTIRIDDSSGAYDGNLVIDDPLGVSLVGSEFVGGNEGAVTVGGGSIVGIQVNTTGTVGTISGLTIRSTSVALRIQGPTTLVTDNVFNDGGADQVDIQVLSGSPTITDNNFTDANLVVRDRGITVDGASPTISDNGFSNLSTAIEAGTTAAASNTVIDGNFISGTHQSTLQGLGVNVQQSSNVVISDNVINSPGDATVTGISVASGGGTGSAQLRRNQVYDHNTGVFLSDLSTTTMTGDVIADSTQNALVTFDDVGAGSGNLTAKNVTITDSVGSATEEIMLGGDDPHLTLDSSIVGDLGIGTPGTAPTCTITRSRGPSTTPGGDGCANFQTTVAPSFINPGSDDYRLENHENAALIDQGDPAAAPLVDNIDFNGSKRVIDGDGDCDEVRDIGADEAVPPAPDAAITGGPAEGSTIATATTSFTFTNSNTCTGSSFECSLDAGSFGPCSSGGVVGPLTEGAHTFRVRALDLVPTAGPEQTRNFIVDLPAPPGPPADPVDPKPKKKKCKKGKKLKKGKCVKKKRKKRR
jgi:hypothetical protein